MHQTLAARENQCHCSEAQLEPQMLPLIQVNHTPGKYTPHGASGLNHTFTDILCSTDYTPNGHNPIMTSVPYHLFMKSDHSN